MTQDPFGDAEKAAAQAVHTAAKALNDAVTRAAEFGLHVSLGLTGNHLTLKIDKTFDIAADGEVWSLGPRGSRRLTMPDGS